MSSCPKAMHYGPCAGVGLDGRCEAAPIPCVFLDATSPRRWEGVHRPAQQPAHPLAAPRTRPAAALLDRLGVEPVVLSDFPIRDPDSAQLRQAARRFRSAVDAVLITEPPSIRRQLPAAYRAALLAEEGVGVWASVNCRDRNRVALEGELAALADAGAQVANCVTGDHPAVGRRPDAKPVFDLDSTELASLARASGLAVSVGESPEVPPVGLRAARFAEKVAAGADIAFLNVNSGPAVAERFVRDIGRLGVARPVVSCVPFIVDEGSASIMTGLPSHVLPDGYVESILGAVDPREAGIAAAVDLASSYLSVTGVAGVCLSGGGSRGGEVDYAAAMAEAAERLRAALSQGGYIAPVY